MMSSSRLAHGVVALAAAAVLITGCASQDEDTTPTPKASTPTTPVTTGASGGIPQAPGSKIGDDLDPATKDKCQAVHSFEIYSYSAHTAPTREQSEVDRLDAGLKEFETNVVGAVPALAEDVKVISKHAQDALAGPPKPGASLPDDIQTSNQNILKYLRTTCKMSD